MDEHREGGSRQEERQREEVEEVEKGEEGEVITERLPKRRRKGNIA